MKQKHLAVIVGAMLVPTFAFAQSADRLDALVAQIEALKTEIANIKKAQSAAAAQAPAQAPAVSASDKKNTVKIGTNAEVTLYGRVMAQVENIKVTDSATAADNLSKSRVGAHNTNIGVKGELDVGGGNAAIFQMEQRVSINGSNGPARGFADRNSGVGFKGDWGTVRVGRWNTPYKDQTIKVDPFNETTLAANTFVMGQVSSLGGDDIFHARQSNSIQYWSPKVNGFSGKAYFTTNTSKTTTVNPYNMSLTLDYDQGPLFAFVGYETHKDSGDLTALATGNDKGVHVGGGYRIGNTTLSVIWEKLSFHADRIGATAAADMSRNAWFLGAGHKFDNKFTLRGGYGIAGNQSGVNAIAGGNAATGAKGLYAMVGYALNGHKTADKTEIFAQYVRLNNDRNASYLLTNNDGANGLSDTHAGSEGAKYNVLSIGVMTYF
ncbi:MAG: porin [Rhodocyclales bacterium]|nr:porin [Rhodocyclales bacterium]